MRPGRLAPPVVGVVALKAQSKAPPPTALGPGRRRRIADVVFGFGFRAAPWMMVVTMVATVVTAVGAASFPVGYRVIVDAVLSGNHSGLLLGAGIVAGLFSFSWVLAILLAYNSSSLRDLVNLYLTSKIATLVNAVPGLEHLERPEYLQELDLVRQNRLLIASGPRQTVSTLQVVVRSITIVVLLGLVYWPLAFLPLFAVAAVVGDDVAARLSERVDREMAEPRRLAGDYFGLAATAAPAKELRSFGLTEELCRRHRAINSKVRRAEVRATLWGAVTSTLGWVIYGAGFVGAIAIVTVRAVHGQASIGEVVMTVALLRRADAQVSGASDAVGQLIAIGRAARHLVWLEQYVDRVGAAASSTSPVPTRLDSGIALEHVNFTYPGTSVPVLTDVSLHLPAGSSVAVVGENGAGKTTLVKLLTGMYPPTSGTIRVDGVDLAEMDLAAWRGRTSAGFQDFVRFQLAAGATVGVGDLPRLAEEAAIGAALEKASAGDVIATLPAGLATPLGWSMAGGRDLSGGQWQKLALGRAMMRDDPLLVILDEPTANLDAPTESALFERFAGAARRSADTAGAVTVLVSHRFSTVRMADLIVVLNGTRVVEVGDHDTLVASGGLYAELFELQASAYR